MRHSTPARLGAAIAAVAVCLPLASASALPGRGASAGSAGIGDTYYPELGNGGYQAWHYAVRVDYTPSTNVVRGVTTVYARAGQPLSRFNLDLALPATAVEVDGRRATFTQSEHELVVTPRRPLPRGHIFAVRVVYAGDPSARAVGGFTPWSRTSDGGAAVGEPQNAAWWFPVNDHPRDKATFDIALTVPRGYEALSNGTLRSVKVKGPRQTWRWTELRPMAPSSAFMTVGQYAVTRGWWKFRPVINAVAVGGGAEGTAAAQDLARTPEVVAWGERLFGPYPFDSLGGVAVDAPSAFAVGTQTRPVYSRMHWAGGAHAMEVVVHANAHMWFGASVSVRSWRDAWLAEGFATYAQLLWSAEKGGYPIQAVFDGLYTYPPTAPMWTQKIGDPGAGHEFAYPVYYRGAMTLIALRNRVGEPTFGRILRSWVRERRYGNGSIEDFVALAERVSGQDLGSFFQAWLWSGTKPAPTVENGFPKDYTPLGGLSPQVRKDIQRAAAIHALEAR